MAKDQLFCFLDVLGFSNIVKTRGLSALYSDYQKLLAAADKQEHEGLAFRRISGINGLFRPFAKYRNLAA